MSRVRVVPIPHVREAARMDCSERILHKGRAPYGWGVFLGFGFDPDFKEVWCETRAEAETIAGSWDPEWVPSS